MKATEGTAVECKKGQEYGDEKTTAILAAETPSLGGNVTDEPRLQSIEGRMAVLAVSAQMPLMLRGRGVRCMCCHAPGAEACVAGAILVQHEVTRKATADGCGGCAGRVGRHARRSKCGKWTGAK